MNKKTEIVKSIILTLLVAMSVVLFANTWVSQWDYSEGGSILSIITSKTGLFGGSGNSDDSTDIFTPATVMLTSGAKRIIVDKGTEKFSSMYGDILSVFLSYNDVSENAEETTEEQWYYQQKNHSIYVDFGINIKREVLNYALGCAVPDNVKTVSSVVFTTNGSATNKLVVYYYNGLENKYYMQATSESAEPIEKLLSNVKGYENIPLAVELGFNTSPEEGFGGQITINGSVPIILESGEAPKPLYKNIKNAVTTLDNRALNKMLKCFGMSVSSANRYADKNGTAMYIDTEGTIKFYDDGKSSIIEYEAANMARGVEFENESAPALGSMVSGGYDIANKMCGYFDLNDICLNVSSDITDNMVNENGEFAFYIDYCTEGIPVYFCDNNKAEHSVELKFNSKGNLVYFKQRIFNVLPTDSKNEFPAVIEAIDNVHSVVNKDIIKIKKIFRGFCINKDESISGIWCVKLEDDETVYLVKN